MPLLPSAKNCDISVKENFQLISNKLGYTGHVLHSSLTLNHTGIGDQLTLSKVCTTATGLNVLRVTGLQTDDTALTGTLRGAYIDVSNGSAVATGTIRAMELKARTEAPGDTGNNVAVLEGLSISADSKAHNVTTMRAAEFILDGKTAGTINEMVGLRIANNLQFDKATTSYGLQIYRDSFDYTYDISLSLGGHITGDSYVNQDLRTTASPTHAGLTLTGLTDSALIGTNASKLLESVTIGTGLAYVRPTLSLSHLGIEALVDEDTDDKIIFWDDSAGACKWLRCKAGGAVWISVTPELYFAWMGIENLDEGGTDKDILYFDGPSAEFKFTNSPQFTAITLTGNLTFADPGTSANSHKIVLIADNATTTQTSEILTCYGADPYLRLSAPNDAGAATAVLDIHDQVIAFSTDNATDIGADGANRPKNYYGSGLLTIAGAITASNYTAANLLTACATNAGALNFSAAGKTLTVEDDAIVSQDYSTDGTPQFAALGINYAAQANRSLILFNNALNVTGFYHGIQNAHTKTLGATDYVDYMYGITNFFEYNQNGGEIGSLCGIHNTVKHSDGGIGDASNNRHIYGVYSNNNLDAGTVYGNVYGIRFDLDQEAAHTITGDAFGLHITGNLDGTVTGTATLLRLTDSSGFDYCIYQTGTSPNVLKGATTVGNSTNYISFAANGLQTMVGTARVTNAIWLPATGMKSVGAKAAVFVEHGLSGAYQFTDGTDDQVVGSIRIPNRMDRSVAPIISIGWSATAIVGNCNWQFEYLWTKANEDTSAGAQDTHTEAATVSGTAEGMVLTAFDSLDLPDSDDVCLHFRLSREANVDPPDTLVGDAELHGICMSFTSNKLGTAT